MTTIELKPSAHPLSDAEREAILTNPGFGKHFTDHMVTIKWTEGRGWHDAQLQPYAPLTLDPATMALHYGQSVFEGLKAYRQPDGSVRTFRPDANARRFQLSARRLAMPELPVQTFVAAIDALVRQDKAWVPGTGEESLYLRPFMFATEVGLGVNSPAREYLFMVLASPAGAYFHGGIKPVSVWLTEEYVRAAPGGTGEAKCAGNYAGAMAATLQAVQQGCDQVVWLDAVERRWIEEMGGMNLYFVRGGGQGGTREVVTPELTGTLLPGITRDSLLTIAADLGYRTREVRISKEEWQAGCADGTISETFACGTAAVITPVGHAKSSTAEWTVADGSMGPVTAQLRKALVDVQTGQAPDPHGWMHELG
ncbi:branched-chain amino acid aminotransferase [Streptomyces sp. WMMC500]|uniref:branched-chain amino acid aminotransferase n=1 Tax=Streptomyces sp. WMMC500 TaxID=3015154 RepID=UPI00248CF774|nr:branched-chain amino acid aminotransferase [Streptomyces sp. WMMC500]WBB62842.1 branched-chain amino acid aminotransferase [Streptomyces sp. WMMC500]